MLRKGNIIAIGLVLGSMEVALGWSILPQNFLGGYLIFIGLGYCIGGAFYLALSPRGGNGAPSGSAPHADRSLLALLPGALLFLLGMPLEYRITAAQPTLFPHVAWLPWLGLGLILAGMLLRIWVRRALKQAYQGNLQVLPGQRLVTGGPYRWIRHPGYTGFILQALGLVAGFPTLCGLLGLVAFILALVYRIHIEEEMLAGVFGQGAFGAQYQGYAARTRRLIPGVW